MRQLHQLKVKLLNSIGKFYVLADASTARDAKEEIEATIDEIFSAFGGCELCYGRGYLATGQEPEFCACPRADALRAFMEDKQNG